MTLTSWVAFQLTGSPWLVALTGVCRAAALPLVGPLSGALADRVDRVLLVRIAEWGNLAALALLTGSILTGHGAYWQLLAVTLWFGVSMALEWPARRALLMDLAGPDHLLRAVVLEKVSQAAARVAGPLLAGFLLAQWDSRAYALIALLPALSLLALGQMATAPPTSTAAATSVWRQLREGLVYVRRHQVLWAVLLITIAMNFTTSPAQQLFAVMAKDVLHVGPVGLGWMGAANGIGAMLALLLIPRVAKERFYGWTFVLGTALASLCLALFAATTSLALALTLLMLSGFGQTGFGVMQSTLMLSRASPALRGRAMGLLTLAIGSAPLGAIEMGAMAERWGTPLAIGVNALLCAVAVAAVAWRSPQLRQAQAATAAASQR